MASTNDLKNGMVLKLEGGQLWSVVEFQHVKPGKGPAFVRTKLKNVLSGKAVDKTFNAGVKVETANVDKRGMQFSYMDGDYFVFMDMDTYDQLHIDRKTVGGPPTSCSKASRRSWRRTRARYSTSSCRPRSS
ncbi:Elongation factor P [Streptomyces rimosus subsp. rimosus]